MGSRQWIGAIELSYVLDTLLGVASRVITVPCGSELPSKAREIAHHFDTQGERAAPSPASSAAAAAAAGGVCHAALLTRLAPSKL